MNQQHYRKLISGQEEGQAAALLRIILRIAAFFYALVIQLRNFLYSKRWLKTHKIDAVVFSVGNITVGGTGKTPLVIWLCRYLTKNLKLKTKNCGYAILTRGYRAAQNSKLKTQNYTDEPAIFTQRCPEAQVIVNPDRVAGAKEAVDKFGAEVLVMDDGFQHRRLARDLDIVTIDATLPFGYGRIFPAGLLREPMTALRRADAAVITRCNQISEPQLAQIEEKLRLINPIMVVARSVHAAICVEYTEPFVIPAKAGIQKNGEIVDSCLPRNDSIKELKNKKIFAFCGIGNPDAFLETVRGLCSELVGSRIYDDHHHYTGNEIADIHQEARHLSADLILTTEKDWTKINLQESGLQNLEFKPQFAYLVIQLQFLAAEDKLTALIEEALEGKIRKDV